MDRLREQYDAARRAAELRREPAAAPRAALGPFPTEGGAGPEPGLAEIQSRLQQAEIARSVLNDALKTARKEIHALSTDLDEARLEQDRIRLILDGLGIHLI